ncbi:hypothetical protein N0B44_06335 [Roseibacterium beibuensis]|uniref:Integrase catalytic domain-containing protein n=1 Tax=[Roseibacterium] beibuensis TaxID=1193142 RepID=A0ABP9KUL3_9RHOB|nr:hypothetical protein [Roseibacterium beibuensis]MCS6622521.1 hypothetical protein [Roseibacterium beibuensis]
MSLKNKDQQALGRFHVAMCQAVDIFVALRRQDNPRFRPTVRNLSTLSARRFIAEQTTLLLKEPVRTAPPRGGEKTKARILYQGRTILKYYKNYMKLDNGEGVAEALVPLTHLRGNRSPRISVPLRDLMTKAWGEFGFDLRGHSIANVHQYLETLVHEENKRRILNELPKLAVPSQKTLREHRDRLVTPTEYAIAVDGVRETRRRQGRGSTDIRGFMVGELCGMDEQKMSLVTSAKEKGFWHTLSDETKRAYEEADEFIRKRLHIIVLFDVASRMPLAWIIAENPNAEATLALLRMATRDKTREKTRYGCKNDPAKGCSIHRLRNDNGTGLRSSPVIASLMGIGTINETTRTYSPTDRAHDERFFGTVESCFFKVMPGYTGRRPGDIPGYDAIKNGVVSVELLYAMLTRYLVDEYPFQKHYGVGMFGRRPWDVYKELNDTRGMAGVIDPHTRRIHLGWQVSTTPSDEGVRVFEGIWFNSDDLQLAREEQFFKGKVEVFVDPDNLNIATVLMAGVPDPIEVTLQTTAFADMTLGEVLQLVAEYRREDPHVTELYHDRLMEARTRRYADISSIGVEHDLPRSYSTIEECKALARAVFAGARVPRTKQLNSTTSPDDVTNLAQSDGVFAIGEEPSIIEGTAEEVPGTSEPSSDEQPTDHGTQEEKSQGTSASNPPPSKGNTSRTRKSQSMKSARPSNLKELK